MSAVGYFGSIRDGLLVDSKEVGDKRGRWEVLEWPASDDGQGYKLGESKTATFRHLTFFTDNHGALHKYVIVSNHV